MTIADRWPLPDRRDAAQLARDQPAVRRQVEKLNRSETEATTRQELAEVLDRIRLRAQRATAPGARRFLSLTPPDEPHTVLIAEGELVIDGDDAQLAACREVLRAYTEVRGPARHSRRRTRVFRRTDGNTRALGTDAQRLRDVAGVQVAQNTIVPLGYIIKGDSYPGSTVAPAAFATNGATAPVRVAVIDTGLTAVTRGDGWDTGIVRDGVDPLDEVQPTGRIDWFGGHGTFAAGIVRQIAPDCELVVYRFTGPDGTGTDDDAADMMLKAVDDAAGKRLIINASFGAPAVGGTPPLALQEAVRHITTDHPDVLIVASAGNDGRDTPFYPAAFDGVTAVGALTSGLTPATFSNKGSWVDCSTVGVGVVSTFVQGLLPPENDPAKLGPDVSFGADSWATWSGTSFSAPQVAAAVAALCGENASLSPKAAYAALTTGRTTLPGYGKVIHVLRGTPV
ncbi:S8 family peptidase [Symbioplanes lichenis]|uniref:S8 family peptidase n=1 Tax=Symbioplanes lichenis TaxID=1629072 RepID=UPI002738A009|nr:S8/S53 family peptidase [Actinoplanes lichenis]